MIQAQIVTEYAQKEYPGSAGMVNCLNQIELENLNQYLYKQGNHV
jgi:hypothetical protein